MIDNLVNQNLKDMTIVSGFEIKAKARAIEDQGNDVIHLELGEPDFDTPDHIVEAGVQALRDGYTHYGPATGLPVLRQSVADYANRRKGLSCRAENMVVTP